MQSRIFRTSLSTHLIYGTLAFSSLLFVSEAQAWIKYEPLHYKDKWEITTSDHERISRQFITRAGISFILNDYSPILYKAARNTPVQEITVPPSAGFKKTIKSDLATLGYDDHLYLANLTYSVASVGSPEMMKSLDIYRLSAGNDQLELLQQSDCQNQNMGSCRFTAPLLVSEKNNAVYSIRRDGDHGWLSQISLDGSNKNWHEIRFDTVVTGQVISADERQLYLQSSSHFYVVDLESGNILDQDALPPSLAEDTVENTLSLRTDDGHTIFGAANNKLFRLNLFNETSPFELVWVKDLPAIKDIALPPNRDVIYAWDKNGVITWVTKAEGNFQKNVVTGEQIKKIQFDPVSGWAYVLNHKITADNIVLNLISPSGAINDPLFKFYADYALLMDADINLKNNVLSIAVESKVIHYDLNGEMEFVDTGKNVSGYALPGTTTQFNWEIGEACIPWCPRETGSFTIDNANTTLLNQYHWPLILAENINKHSDLMRIGEKDENGIIRPLASEYRNKIWLLNYYKDARYILNQKVTPQPDIVSSWKLNPTQSGITADRNLAAGTNIQVTVTLPNGSQRPLPIFTVTRGSKYLWPADLARFINSQASQLDLPIAAGERLADDALTTPSSHYRNRLWVPANDNYTLHYDVKP